jgi:sterol desaturase/sphingolipid hydroxylase (fatty acid hydroxylase superfamily)
MEQVVQYKALILLGVFVVLFALERAFLVARNEKGTARYFRNVGLWALTIPLSPLIVLPITLWASSHALWQRPDWWSGGAGLLLDILILDCWIYFMHRAMHEVPFLWRFHEIHHRDETLDTTSAFRFHFGEVAISALVRSVVIIALGMPFTSVVIFETCVLTAALFQHSNVKLPRGLERVLSWFIVTPSIHWVHHHVLRADTNSNYGNIFSWWDRLFGTKSRTARTPEMPIGLDDARDIPLQMLIVQPFKRRQGKQDA